MDLKIRYPLSCSSTVNMALVLASTSLRNMSLKDDSYPGWIFSSASVRVPVTLS